MASFGEGDAGTDLKWVLGIILVLGAVWIISGGPVAFKNTGHVSKLFSIPDVIPKAGSQPSSSQGERGIVSSREVASAVVATTSSGDSVYKGQVSITLGRSGEVSKNTNLEYVTLTASSRNKTPINISGWIIDNGKGGKYYDAYGRIVPGKSTQVAIPFGTTILTGVSKSYLAPIRLSPGGKAYVITGRMPNQNPYLVDASFQATKCTGYLEALPNYNFTPSLSLSCPSYKEETKDIALSDSCLKLVDDYGSNCHTPVISKDPKLGELVDKKVLSGDCKKIILSKFNYVSCFSRHLADKDFYKKDWRVYLNYNGFPLYAQSRATITLYDSLGKLVDTYSY